MPPLPAILAVLATLVLAFLIAGAGFGAYAYARMLRIRRRSPAEIERISLEKEEFPREALSLPWRVERIASPLGYALVVHALPGSGDRVALFHHGVTWNWMGAIKYAEPFRLAGWTVVTFDSRGHGESGGRNPSYGWFEKLDLLAVADWALATFPSAGGFVAHGESLGAASVLQYAAMEPRLDGVVADCPFSGAGAELDHQLRRRFLPRPLRSLAIAVCGALTRRLEGFPLAEARPDRAILETGLPMLLVHGLEDDYVPWRMSEAMAAARRAARPEAETLLELVPGARHAASFKEGPAAYSALVLDFAERAAAAGAGRAARATSSRRCRPRPD